MGMKTTVSEWMKFIDQPLPGVDSYIDNISISIGGVSAADAFDYARFAMLHPDEPVIIESGIVFTDGQGIGLIEHYNNWRRDNGIPTTTFVTFEIPDERLDAFMAKIRRHGYEAFISDESHAHEQELSEPQQGPAA